MKTTADYKNDALNAIKGNWTPVVLGTLATMVILAVCNVPSKGFIMGIVSFALTVFVANPINLGYDMAFLRLLDSGNVNVLSNVVGYSFTGDYKKKILTLLLMDVFIALWTLLLVVPGIIKSFAYSMTTYIIAENPQLSCREAIDLSSKMMEGHKLDLFILYLSFIGWILLAVLTCGIGLLWVTPYMQTAKASFYMDIRDEYRNAQVA